MNEIIWHKNGLFFMFSEMHVRKHHLFCPSSHHNVPYEKQQELNKGSEPWNKCPCKGACVIVKYALDWHTPERTTWRKYLEDYSMYIEISTIDYSSWVDEWDLSQMV